MNWKVFKLFAPQIFSLLYILFTIILVSINYSNLTSFHIIFNQLFNNWQNHIITDITLSTTSTCPDQYEPFSTYYFPGTSLGYYCVYDNNELIKWSDSCDQESNSYKPSEPDVNISIPAQTFYNWGRTSLFTYQQLCVKPYLNYTFYSNSTLYQNGQCPLGYIQCGGPSETTITCIPNGVSCPIDQITITTGLCTIGSSNCLIIDTITNKIITWQRNSTNAYPIVESRINEYAMCIDANSENITPNRAVYALNNRPTGTCKTIDLNTNYSWIVLDSVTEEYFYTVNSILTTINTLPQMNETRNYPYYLYVRRYFDLNMTCRGRLKELQDTNDEQISLIKIFLATIIMNSIMGGLLAFSVCCQKFSVDSNEVCCLTQCIVCAELANRILDIFNIIIKGVSFSISNNVNGVFEYFKTCSNDATYNNVIPTIAGYFTQINITAIVVLVGSCIWFAIQSIILIIKIWKKKIAEVSNQTVASVSQGDNSTTVEMAY